jgi:hypothetical protein
MAWENFSNFQRKDKKKFPPRRSDTSTPKVRRTDNFHTFFEVRWTKRQKSENPPEYSRRNLCCLEDRRRTLLPIFPSPSTRIYRKYLSHALQEVIPSPESRRCGTISGRPNALQQISRRYRASSAELRDRMARCTNRGGSLLAQ